MAAIFILFRKMLQTLLVHAIAMRFHDQAQRALTSISLSNKILLLSTNAAFLNFTLQNPIETCNLCSYLVRCLHLTGCHC